MEYQASLARVAVMTLARVRAGTPEDAVPYLDEYVDRYLVTVPMGFKYDEITERCQNALALGKLYRSRYPSPKHLEDQFHLSRLWNWIGVPDLPADHYWLDQSMKKVADMRPART
jgi:hypothetical protein